MKNLIAVVLISFLLSCNNSATVTPETDADRTQNRDTAPVPDTSVVHKDSGNINH
jgi:hypothetical protein